MISITRLTSFELFRLTIFTICGMYAPLKEMVSIAPKILSFMLTEIPHHNKKPKCSITNPKCH